MRVFALSDLHADFAENWQLLCAMSATEYRDDALIVAGDVTHDLARLRRVLSLLRERFADVCFVPGNHELWVHGDSYPDSIGKLHDVLTLCADLGVHTAPVCLGEGAQRVCLVPLFSWYTLPEEGADSLYRAKERDDPELTMWADRYLVRWPEHPGFQAARFLRDLNTLRVQSHYDASVVSFSHFLPRAELMFATPGETPSHASRTESSFNFSRVAGSTLLEDQIRALRSRVHVYGHQHRNRCRLYDGTWYVSHCLGYPGERAAGAFEPRLVWPPPLSREEVARSAVPTTAPANP